MRMTSEQTDWERFFDAHAPVYMDNVFTRDAVREGAEVPYDKQLQRAVLPGVDP